LQNNVFDPRIGLRFDRAYAIIEEQIAISRDWKVRRFITLRPSWSLTPAAQNGTYVARAAPVTLAEVSAHAAPVDAGMLHMRDTHILHLYKLMVRLCTAPPCSAALTAILSASPVTACYQGL